MLKPLAALSLALTLASCSMQPAHPENRKAKVKISTASDPTSLDPRKIRDLLSVTFVKSLYEGLMRISPEGNVEPAIAEYVEISPDRKTYTFYLRKSTWSDGTPLTAKDFEETWKSLLDPSFPAPNAYQFYLIKGAKEAKEGRVSLEEVAISALDEKRLMVELVHPSPSFLQLVASHFYLPSPKETRLSKEAPEVWVSNGPFTLKRWEKNHEIELVKNPSYWMADSIEMDKLLFYVLDDHTALQMFETGELDWTGSPLSTLPQEAISTLKEQKRLHTSPAAGVFWFRVNTATFPFDQVKMRKAFAFAIDRKSLVQNVITGGQKPALGIIPPSFDPLKRGLFQDHNVTEAFSLFQEVLEKNHLSKEDLPPIKLTYSMTQRNHKIAQVIQQQWEKAFGISISLQNVEPKILFERLKKGEFQLIIGSWFADIRDPMNFLDVFSLKTNPTNNTFWENAKYTTLLKESEKTEDPLLRKEYLTKAESLLMEEMPIIPLFFGTFPYLKKEKLKGVFISDLGYLDLRYATWQ